MARRTREENLEIIRQAAEKYSSKPVANAAQTGAINAPSAVQDSRKRTREENIEIIRQAAEAYSSKPKNNTVDNSKFSSSSGKIPSVQRDTAQRSKLQKELDRLNQAATYVTTTDESDRIERQRQPIIEQLRKLDAADGKSGVYTGVDRLKNSARNMTLAVQQGLTEADHRIAQTADWLLGGIAREGRAFINASLQALNPNWGFENEDPLITQYNKKGAEVLSQNDAIAQRRIGEGKMNATAWRYAPEVVAAVPDAVLAIVTGGASSGMQATTAGLETASAIAQGSRAAQKIVPIANAAKDMMKSPAWQSSFAQSAGASYEAALADGATEEEANLYALVNGYANATVEVGGSDEGLGGIQKLPRQVREAVERGDKNVVMQWVKSTLSEAKEEVVQGAAEKALRGIYADDVPLYSNTDDNAVINPSRAKEEALGGLVVGGVLGGGQTVLQTARNGVSGLPKRRASQIAQDVSSAQGDISAPPRGGNASTANSGALNAALETWKAFEEAGYGLSDAAKVLSPQQKAALEDYLYSMSAFSESRPTESKAISHKRDGVPISENVYRKIAPEMEKASEAYSEAEAKRTAQRKIAEQQREEIGKRRGKEKPVEFFGDVGYDGFKFDYKAARAEGEAEYRKKAKKWYEAHPNAESISPDSPLYDMNSYVNKYVRKKSKQAFDEYVQNEELLSPIRYSDQSSPNMKDKLAEKTQQERLREEDGRETRFDDRPEYAAAVESAKDVSGKYIGEKAVSTRKIDYKHSDKDAPPPTAFERQAARMVQESYEDTRQELKQRDTMRESVTKDATENMKRKAEAEKVRNEAMQEYVRKLEAATTPEEKAQAKAEYRKAIGLDTETTAEAKPETIETTEEVKGGNENDSSAERLEADAGTRESRGGTDEVSGLAGREPGGREEASGTVQEVVRRASRDGGGLGLRNALAKAGYKVIEESNQTGEVKEAVDLIKKLTSDNPQGASYVTVLEDFEGRPALAKKNRPDIGIILNAKGDGVHSLKQIATHEATHIQMPSDVRNNAWNYLRKTFKDSGLSHNELVEAIRSYGYHKDYYAQQVAGVDFDKLEKGSPEYFKVLDMVSEELICDLNADVSRAFPEGSDISKLVKTVRDDFISRGVFPEGAFDSEVQAQPQYETEVSDDYEDMPFTFGSEESSTSPKYTEEQTVRWKAKLSERRDSNGVRRSYPSEAIHYAEETYGKQLSEIQENAKALTDRQTMYGSADFKEQFGNELSQIAVERVNKFKGLVDDVAHGISSMGDLYKAYDAIKDDAFLKDYYNEATAEAISKAYDSLKEADAYPTPYNVARFRWDSVRAVAMTAKSFERGAQAQIDKTAFARAANENLKVLKTKKNASGKEVPTASSVLDWYWREQWSAPNVFRSVDGWKDSGGIGYQLADQAEKSFIRQTFEYAKGEDCFYGVNKAEGFEDFVEGKKKVSVDIGNMDGKVRMTEAEAVTLLKSVQTIMASGGKARADSLSGINVGGKSYAFGKKFELNSLVGQIESQLSPAGKAYMDAFTNMLDYYSTPLRETHREVYGGDKGMYAKGNYMPLQYAYADGKVRMPDIAADANLGYDSTRIMQSRGDSHSGYLRIDPAMKVAEWYMRNASDYIAYSAFSERLKALNNSTQYSPSMAEVMSDHYGKNGKQWIDNYVKGVGKTRAEETTTGTDFLKSMRMKMYKGALGLSPTVPLKQWASYWSAADVVGIGNLRRAYRVKLVPAKGNSLQNSVMRSRRRGSIDRTYSDIQESTSAIDRLVKKSSAVKFLTEGIPRSDYKVLDNIYTACELAVQQENPGIDIDSEEYRGLVDDKFNLAAVRTQSVYAPTISAQIQRTGSELEKMLSMFRTQQVQDLARTIKAINEYKAAAPENKAKYAKTLRNSLTGTALSSLSLGVMTQVARLMLHKKKDYEDEEGNFDWGLFAKATGVDTLKSVTGLAWFGDEVTSLLLSAVTQGDEPYFGLSAGVISTYEDVVDSFIKFCENPTAYNGKRVIGSVGTLSGVPINNVYSLLNSVVMYSMDATGKNDDNYDDVLKWLRNETGGNVKNFRVGDEELDLSRKEKMVYKNTYDVQYSQLFSWMAVSSDYMKLTDEQKEAVNKAAKEYATYRARKVIVEDRDPSAIVSHDQWQELPERQIVKYLVAKQQATALLDSDGKIDDYAAADKFLTEKYGDLPAEQKQMLNNIGGLTRLDDMYAASKQGIDSRTYQLAYKMYKALDDSNINSTQKQERLKTFISGLKLRDTQKEWLENNLQMFRVTPIDTAMYDKFVDAGLTNGKAEDLRNDFRDLEILPDHSAVTNNQKYAAIMNADYLSEDEKWKAFFAIATSSASKEAATNRALGLTYEQWLTTSRKYGKIE